METIEHFAKISLVARLLGRENLISREEVLRLQGLRGTYGIKAPAPICADPTSADIGASGTGATDVADCQVVQAPSASGARLVPDLIDGRGGSIRRRWRRRNSVNIPRTLRAHRRRGPELTLERTQGSRLKA